MISSLLKEKIVAVVRADTPDQAKSIVAAVVAGGIRAIEITFTVPNATEVIHSLHDEYGDEILLGAGTVLDEESCRDAVHNGASYIVSPGFDSSTARCCADLGIPYIPGCLTPTEVLVAMKAGCQLIKLFPGSAVDPNYVRALKAPYPEIRVMVTGGVDLDNLAQWFAQGTDAVGIGGALTKSAASGDYQNITAVAQQYVQAIKDVT